MTEPSTKTKFSYDQAFDRNIGWLTQSEQTKLHNSCIAIAGLGGAGGFQAQALARLGVGHFKLADLDTFELTNINRQIGATVDTLGHPKVTVIRDMILAINPEAKVEIFEGGINEMTVDRFLEGAHVGLDGIDFFAQNTKLLFFKKCHEKKIPAVTACPLGFGASLLIFSPDGMTYEDYFDLTGQMSEKEKRIISTIGLSPSPLCFPYMDVKALDLNGERASSVSPALMLVAALCATETVKILTGKRKVCYCPHVYQVDLMTQKIRRKYFPLGMKSPWQRIKRRILLRLMNTQIYYLLRPRKFWE